MKRTLPLAALALAAVAAACASGGTPEPATTRTVFTNTQRGIAMPEGGTDMATLTATGVAAQTTMSTDSTMRALAAAYTILHVPPTLVDPDAHRVGNPRMAVRYNLNGEPLSRFVNCGETMTSVRADREQIYLAVISTVRPNPGGGNTVETTVQGVAVDRTSGNSNGMVPCSTTGTLESRIHRTALGIR
ncbi:hypothetical protein [Longimicrobium sp.]|uniref:hypothetical protein n=1 Tax=Longimicrobium sp. TaxID=2029185 RepID=UPI002B9F4A36|nr:hypothetical protein [Longimicrobium sp.]HSU14543.1 hypothetical protein [Longimicrobium sp.]